MRGRVIQSTGSWYQVTTENQQIFPCKLRGNFKIKGLKSTNPIAVGDWVIFDWDTKLNHGNISKIENRSNYIIRKSVNLSKRSHIIAANIDLALLVITIANPRTSKGFIDRFLVTAEAYHIPTYLIFNKIDLLANDLEQETLLHSFINDYRKIGYPCLAVSAKTGENIDALKVIMKDKVSLVAGHSGVGKSALINTIDPKKNLKIGDISTTHNKGKHTTTFAEMHSLSFGAYIIDSPGIKEFGLYDINKEELSQYFPEILSYINQCKFNNCTHIHEPDCAVKKAVLEGKILASRYENYLLIFNGEEMNQTDYLD